MIVVMQQTTQTMISLVKYNLNEDGCSGIVLLVFEQDEW